MLFKEERFQYNAAWTRFSFQRNKGLNYIEMLGYFWRWGPAECRGGGYEYREIRIPQSLELASYEQENDVT